MNTLLKVSNLKKHFPIRGGLFGKIKGYVYAIDGVSLSIQEGETLGLVGESGCGKSTLGRAIIRLYEPTSGEIQFMGEDLLKLSSEELRKKRREMQIVFQDPYSSLNPRMTVGDILAEPFIIHEVGNRNELSERVDQLLNVVGLSPEVKDRYPHEFSGGQRQRIGIARALALEPKLIVADEPVSALDVSIQSQILNLMVDLRTKFKLTYLFIAHDLAVIEHISDKVAVMYLGKIVEYASTSELYSNPKHPYTKALMAAIPVPFFAGKKERKKQLISGDVPSPISPPSGCHFHPRCPQATDLCKTTPPTQRNLGSSDTPHLVSCHHALSS